MSLHEAKTILEKTMTDHITLQGEPVMFNLFGALARFADALIRIEARLDGLASGLHDLSNDVRTIEARSRK